MDPRPPENPTRRLPSGFSAVRRALSGMRLIEGSSPFLNLCTMSGEKQSLRVGVRRQGRTEFWGIVLAIYSMSDDDIPCGFFASYTVLRFVVFLTPWSDIDFPCCRMDRDHVRGMMLSLSTAGFPHDMAASAVDTVFWCLVRWFRLGARLCANAKGCADERLRAIGRQSLRQKGALSRCLCTESKARVKSYCTGEVW